MNNQQFLTTIKKSFLTFLRGFEEGKNGSRSTEKLKILHGAIANDLATQLGTEYSIQSIGFEDDKEASIQGRYIDKKVDITILQNNQPIAGIGIKFVMQNYAQNSNNYFENMLGETANIQCCNIPYFQILVLPEKIPYFSSGRIFKKWEILTAEKIKKYLILSNDPQEQYLHTPAKTLLYIISLYDTSEQNSENLAKNSDFFNYYKKNHIKLSNNFNYPFGKNVIFNNYEEFIKKITHRIQSI
ncbi:MAG: hypothetical protein Q4A49_04730 [Neisseria sp.]|nr:hypothetical protein [Neisseria sp.]